MPRYRVQLSDGRVVTVEGDHPPTEAEVLAQLGEQPPKAPERSWTDVAVDALPAAGGALGGFVGGAGGAAFGMGVGGVPGAIGGAALGAGSGEAFKQLINRARGKEAPETSLEAATNIGGAAVKEGVMEGAGRGVGKAFTWAAPRIARTALAPIESVARKYGGDEGLDLGTAYVREGKLFNNLFKRGGIGAIGKTESEKQALKLTGQSRQQFLNELYAADRAGAAPVSSRQVVAGLQPVLKKERLLAQAGNPDRTGKVVEQGQRFLQRNPATMTNEAAAELLKEVDNAADAAHVARRMMTPKAELRGEMNKAIGDQLRGQIRTNVPTSTKIAGRTRDLAGLSRALGKDAVRQHLLTRNMAANTAIGLAGSGLGYGYPEEGGFGSAATGGLSSLALAYLLMNPTNLGRMSLGAQGVGQAMQYSPQMVRALLLALQNQGEDESAVE